MHRSDPASSSLDPVCIGVGIPGVPEHGRADVPCSPVLIHQAEAGGGGGCEGGWSLLGGALSVLSSAAAAALQANAGPRGASAAFSMQLHASTVAAPQLKPAAVLKPPTWHHDMNVCLQAMRTGCMRKLWKHEGCISSSPGPCLTVCVITSAY